MLRKDRLVNRRLKRDLFEASQSSSPSSPDPETSPQLRFSSEAEMAEFLAAPANADPKQDTQINPTKKTDCTPPKLSKH